MFDLASRRFCGLKMLAMYDYVLNLARAVDRKRNIFFAREQTFVHSKDSTAKNAARRIAEICWPDRLLFIAIAGCLLSASGIIPKALSSVAIEFLLVCSMVLTGVMLFWLLCPVSVTDVLAILRFPAEGASEKHGQSQNAGSSYMAISRGKIVPEDEGEVAASARYGVGHVH